MSHTKKPAALALATVLAGGSAVLLAAPAAQATVQDVNYQCKTPIGDKSAVSPIDIKSVKSGSAYKLTMSFQKGVSSSPVELGKGAMKPSAVIKLGGAESGTVPVSGATNAEAIPANTPIKISDLSGTYTPKKSGKVTFTAGVLTIKALGTTTTCTPSNNPKPSLELDVKGAGGSEGSGGSGGSDASGSGASGGSGTTGGSDSAPSGGGELPQTGPADSAVALGTLGGTVLLAGAAGALWLTRRNQAARSR
ncbi:MULTISPECIES: LPXTG cell wall anchor domain-containing protein [Streptomyces]|uniref:Peptidase n=1 Tax=Streptomyces venezuelae TaxID=54571 RepID=A0A5P2BCE4_STRVZ|nr:LPXTG cell wall anchor domain-containing protein [Streptomyces venezuelae]MYY85923.1 LPXTG cell wall anchor domain-containing protein [Streptomyces sp. SID335]MYZ18259.1 LPXTG cell wall anchor domain-containing protein [Streptomyces sp. SID337]NDZ92237.1 LPXTG cell wall anchor domain-containing protein [Streptomyces sp. SID10115]NEB44893.1 LPXTG cell wall anchor domain-containing protein [Streptomyces sp. SID339]MYZ18835.1 LPXTG cell wall anchor domain-containing protein [Streptomyces sp. S